MESNPEGVHCKWVEFGVDIGGQSEHCLGDAHIGWKLEQFVVLYINVSLSFNGVGPQIHLQPGQFCHCIIKKPSLARAPCD